MKKRFGIFFDLDGTIIENEHLKAIAFSRAIEKFGGKSHPSIYKEVMGMSGQIIRKHFVDKANLCIDLDEYYELFKSIYDDLIKTRLIIKAGTTEFLDELKSKDIEMAVISSAYSSSVNYIIDTLNLRQYFNLIVTGDDIEDKKPAPDCYLFALEKLNLAKGQVIVFEDTEAGLKSAFDAGLKTLAIRHDYNQSHDFSYAISEYVSYDIKQLRNDINKIFRHKVL